MNRWNLALTGPHAQPVWNAQDEHAEIPRKWRVMFLGRSRSRHVLMKQQEPKYDAEVGVPNGRHRGPFENAPKYADESSWIWDELAGLNWLTITTAPASPRRLLNQTSIHWELRTPRSAAEIIGTGDTPCALSDAMRRKLSRPR